MGAERYYLLQIESLREELKEIDLELDAIFEILACDKTPMYMEGSSVTKYLLYRSTKLKVRREEINKEIESLKEYLSAQKRFDKYGFLITEEQEKLMDKE